MHDIDIRQEIIDRVLARRNRYHLFDALDPQATAFVIIDMQNTFCEPGAPAEVPVARDICSNINTDGVPHGGPDRCSDRRTDCGPYDAPYT